MKKLLIIIDGFLDKPIVKNVIPDIFNIMPNLTMLWRYADISYINTCPNNMPVDSMVCNLTLLGIVPSQIPVGRCFLEVMGLGIKFSKQDVIFRCNIVKLDDKGNILQSTAEEAVDCMPFNSLIGHLDIRLEKLQQNKYFAICSNFDKVYVKTLLPHQNIGNPIENIKNKKLLEFSSIINDNIPKNYKIVPWDYSVYSTLPECDGLVICKEAIILGIAKSMNMKYIIPPNATGNIDTSLSEKFRLAVEKLQTYNFVVLHINGADEVGHARNIELKHSFLTKIDNEIPCFLESIKDIDVEVSICGDHVTCPKTGSHLRSLQPMIKFKGRK